MQKKCPYCIQDIPVEAKICPYCESKLKNKTKVKKSILFPLGCYLSLLWCFGNIVILLLITKFPFLITYKDKDGFYQFFVSDYAQLCFIPLVYMCIPFVISILKNVQRSNCISMLILDVFLALCCIGYCSHLFDTVR